MQSYKMKVSKKENGAYVEVGEVEVFYPLLSELGLAVEPSGKDEDGFPTYADEKVQFVFDSILSAVKASARNKLVSGSVELKDGNKIAETVEELLATGERSGAALALRREFFADFKAFLPSLGKSQAYAAGIYDIVSNIKGICNQSAARKALISDIVGQFAGTLDAAKLASYERLLTQIAEQVEAVSELPD